MDATTNGLRSIVEAARDKEGCSLKAFTVLSLQIDPYRLDTPANHEVGRWFKPSHTAGPYPLLSFSEPFSLRAVHPPI